MNEVQLALDNAVETYYADIAKSDTYSFILADSMEGDSAFVSAFGSTWAAGNHIHDKTSGKSLSFSSKSNDSAGGNVQLTVGNINRVAKDSLLRVLDPTRISSLKLVADSMFSQRLKFKSFANKVFISMSREIDLSKLHENVAEELARKNLDIAFALKSMDRGETTDSYNQPESPRYQMSTLANTTYQQGTEKLEMRYTNASLTILKRGLTDLIISVLISLTVIGALLYLYRIINQQKQLAEIKNDLISNITHEFKTPIATVATAIEGIANFNELNDPGKTKKYLDISSEQLKKLNVMVEKLLETATLDTGALELNKTPVNLSLLLHTMIEKYSMVAQNKDILLLDESRDVVIEADAFHLENAISNLIDNAVKYGGDHIRVSLARQQGSVQVVVQDDGGFIEKGHKERVFDKFYRIPKGNQHDVKGFGIGLYYSKKIIEKHGGTLELVLAPDSTSFEVAI